MSVILNEVALGRLLESETGPVGRKVQREALEVVQQARQNVGVIMARSGVNAASAIDFTMVGSTAIIGIRDEGKITRYLDIKAANPAEIGGPGDWMRNALRAVFRL